MGIDAQTYSTQFPKKTIGRARGIGALKLFENSARNWAQEKGLDLYYQATSPSETGLQISLLPTVDPVFVTTTDNGLSVGFRSSNGGPGYHAAVIEMLDAIAAALKIDWNWGLQGDDFLDETGYALHRNFKKLQNTMSSFLQSLMGVVHEQGLVAGAICIEQGLGQSQPGLSCPLGVVPIDFQQLVLDADQDQLNSYASSFFLWWEKDTNILFWDHLVRGLLWQKAQFRSLLTDEEKLTTAQIESAAKMFADQDGILPSDLEQALKEMRSAHTRKPFNDVSKIGYLKDVVAQRPFENWTIELPGTMILEPASEPGVCAYYDDEFSLQVSYYTFTLATPDAIIEWPDMGDVVKEGQGNELDWRIFEHTGSDSNVDGIHQTAAVLYKGLEHHRLLILTLTALSLEKLSIYQKWLESIRFQSNNR